jgi:hypothetical protein
MPRFGLREAAAMRLVIEQRAPETFERSALRRLARLCQDTRAVALKDAAVAAAALEQLSQPVARATLAARCARRSEREAAAALRDNSPAEDAASTPMGATGLPSDAATEFACAPSTRSVCHAGRPASDRIAAQFPVRDLFAPGAQRPA